MQRTSWGDSTGSSLLITSCALSKPTSPRHPTLAGTSSLLKRSPSWSDSKTAAWFSSCSRSDFSWVPMCSPFPHLPVSERMTSFIFLFQVLFSLQISFIFMALITKYKAVAPKFISLTEMERVHTKHLLSGTQEGLVLLLNYLLTAYMSQAPFQLLQIQK